MSDFRLWKLQGSEPWEGKPYRRNLTLYVLAYDAHTALAASQERHPGAEFHSVNNLTPVIQHWQSGDFIDARPVTGSGE